MRRISPVILTIFAFMTVVPVKGQMPVWGKCPEVETVANFDINKYIGKWREIESFFHFFELGLSCITTEFSIRAAVGRGSHPAIILRNHGFSQMHLTEISSDGEIYMPDPTGAPSKLKVNFPNVTGTVTVEDPNYWVIDTDYDTYSVVWSCSTMEVFGASFMNAQSLWILGRMEKLPEIILGVLKDRLKAKGINPAGLVLHDNESCKNRPNSTRTDSSLRKAVASHNA